MSNSPVSYRLSYSALEYTRRPGPMSSLLFSLSQQALIMEQQGRVIEEVHCHLTSDGDHRGILMVDEGDALPGEAAA